MYSNIFDFLDHCAKKDDNTWVQGYPIFFGKVNSLTPDNEYSLYWVYLKPLLHWGKNKPHLPDEASVTLNSEF